MRIAARDDYDELHGGFRWLVPERFNIAQACCTRWAGNARRTAIVVDHGDGRVERVGYRRIHEDAERLASALAALGVRRGDRVAVVLPQRPEVAVAHMAIYRLGAVAMPLSISSVPTRCATGSTTARRSSHRRRRVRRKPSRPRGDTLRHVVVVPSAGERPSLQADEHDYGALLARARGHFAAVDTLADDPAVLIYTSGTTGPPKGALIPHRALIGNLSGFVASQNWFPRPRDVFWSPADWAWTGGLMDALLPTLYFGYPIVAQRGRFSPERAFELLERHRVTNTFLFPTALKMMMKHAPEPRARHRLALRAIASAGEAVGETLFDWCRDALGVTVNEMFGQTEVNYVVGNSAQRWPARPGSIGRATRAIGSRSSTTTVASCRRDSSARSRSTASTGTATRTRCSSSATGATTRRPARSSAATGAAPGPRHRRPRRLPLVRRARRRHVQGGRVPDRPQRDRELPGAAPAVANAAVVPRPDAERGNVVKAFVVLAPGHAASPALVEQLQQHVRGKLAPYEYPKEIEFIAELPMTTTGKVQRRVLREREQARG